MFYSINHINETDRKKYQMWLYMILSLPFYNETTRTNIAADVLNTETENLSFAQVSQFTDEDVYNHLHPSPGS